MRRRVFLGTGLAAAAVAIGAPAVAQTARVRRVAWNRFRQTPGYARLSDAFDSLRRNQDQTDPNSLEYWAQIHKAECPHGKGYFLGWHRGFLARFEARLRRISGDQTLAIPYWDYFTDPQMPIEFLQQETPFFHWSRTNTNVRAALGYGFTEPNITAFETGRPNALEPTIELWPHNKVHSLIGGEMASMTSPRDPIFWLHHSNIDRLWRAWIRAAGGRAMPPRDSSYWRSEFRYGPEAPIARADVYDTVASLGYDYDVETLPSPSNMTAPGAPAVRGRPMTPGGTDGRTLALAETRDPLVLGDSSFSVRAPLSASSRSTVGAALSPQQPPTTARPAPPPPPPPPPAAGAGPAQPPPVAAAPAPEADEQPAAGPRINLVLEDVQLTAVGRDGGFFYDVYVNLPRGRTASQKARLVGSFGPFEIATAAAHDPHGNHGNRGVTLVLPATEALRDLPSTALKRLTISFVRVDGPVSPRGPAITVGSFRIEVVAD